jgi:hypothetical protein
MEPSAISYPFVKFFVILKNACLDLVPLEKSSARREQKIINNMSCRMILIMATGTKTNHFGNKKYRRKNVYQ